MKGEKIEGCCSEELSGSVVGSSSKWAYFSWRPNKQTSKMRLMRKMREKDYLRVKKAKKVVKSTHLKNSPTDAYCQQQYQCKSEIKCEGLIKYIFAFRLSDLSISRFPPH